MTNFKRVKFIAILMISTLIIGCDKDDIDCISGEGTVSTQTLSISDFTGMDLSFSSNVIIKQGATQVVKATGHPNIINKITTSVSNKIWEIDLDDGCYNNYELAIEITIPNINQIEISGSGNITVDNFTNQSDLTIDMGGSGNLSLNDFEGITTLNVTLSGSGILTTNNDITTLKTFELNNSGSGQYSGFTLSSENCKVNSSGSGDCEISVVNTLDVILSGSGNVSYKGTPTITKNVSGSGELNDAN